MWFKLAASLEDWDFTDLTQARVAGTREPLPLDGFAETAEATLLRPDAQAVRYDLKLSAAAEQLRWFVLPQDIVFTADQVDAVAGL